MCTLHRPSPEGHKKVLALGRVSESKEATELLLLFLLYLLSFIPHAHIQELK